ncbi:MAG: hydrogenase iron-sulfur subunit [Desulfobacter sp.]|nr:MAG: hydrogenase iron-sulfur subunit [Desulfobacter sp.]
MDGNHKAKARIAVVKLMLEDAGINPERVAIEWVSGAEGPRFAQKVTEFTEKIRALGPNTFKARHQALEEEAPCQ